MSMCGCLYTAEGNYFDKDTMREAILAREWAAPMKILYCGPNDSFWSEIDLADLRYPISWWEYN